MVEAELPEESVAVHVTIVSPSGNTSGASLVIEDTSTISFDSGIVICTEFASRFTASCVIFCGVVISGAVVSTTEIV